MFHRKLKIHLPDRQSAFLWGARQTGKSTYLKEHFPNSLTFDLLKSDLLIDLLKEPHRLREEILYKTQDARALPIIVDEVQKVPLLLDEIHGLIESHGLQFILCGSSARKLKRGHANLLGGRAWRYRMYPLVSCEIPDFNLLQALNRGLIPTHYTNSHYRKALHAYVTDYLKEEIRAEGLTRNLPAFAKFLDAVAYSNSELVNFSNIASDCGVDSKTVRDYFGILEDTHLGYLLPPLERRRGRQAISSTPKFYLFDVGLGSYLTQTHIETLRGPQAGKAFEHFILTELWAYRDYSERHDMKIRFWRTKMGQEVDFVLGEEEVFIETKISSAVKKSDLSGLIALMEESHPKSAYLVCNESRPRRVTTPSGQSISILPWNVFLHKLWAGDIIR